MAKSECHISSQLQHSHLLLVGFEKGQFGRRGRSYQFWSIFKSKIKISFNKYDQFVISKEFFELRALRPLEQSQANPFRSWRPGLEPEASKMGPTQTLSNNIAGKLLSLCVPSNNLANVFNTKIGKTIYIYFFLLQYLNIKHIC